VWRSALRRWPESSADRAARASSCTRPARGRWARRRSSSSSVSCVSCGGCFVLDWGHHTAFGSWVWTDAL
jgi:hypothetical protein